MFHLWHRWVPIKGFYTEAHLEDGFYKHQESLTGYKCRVCGRKKVSKNYGQAQSKAATEAAYNWLNYVKNEEA